MRSTKPERSVLFLLAGALLVLGIAFGGCGGNDDDESAEAGADGSAMATQDRPRKPVGEYEEVLLDLRDAAAAGEIYDAYGFAEYMPLSQRAAIDGFCFVTESLLDRGETDRFADSRYVDRRVAAQARLEFDHGAPGDIEPSEMATTRKAIRKLRSIIAYEAIDEELAGNYVTACYNRGA